MIWAIYIYLVVGWIICLMTAHTAGVEDTIKQKAQESGKSETYTWFFAIAAIMVIWLPVLLVQMFKPSSNR